MSNARSPWQGELIAAWIGYRGCGFPVAYPRNKPAGDSSFKLRRGWEEVIAFFKELLEKVVNYI
jgi:hypothetical protein